MTINSSQDTSSLDQTVKFQVIIIQDAILLRLINPAFSGKVKDTPHAYGYKLTLPTIEQAEAKYAWEYGYSVCYFCVICC
ncbi:hypothetical protein [secondary endosymbiont of Ctenarytaina eucalypti]|uniref:Uncharacterized protein n=1 Tax=secondary endosymbiont of Ctenarytaina eucalypti TaxID=1199245 RepID=J3YSC1_9ENTR|nr:hypothetical protein [secondary endosymbiont of Ctenarytaina eucalypti]AFP85123.1 hypothetical protein A359_07530 [secondary endosymbiont of Ctenarytaina eucalypti]